MFSNNLNTRQRRHSAGDAIFRNHAASQYSSEVEEAEEPPPYTEFAEEDQQQDDHDYGRPKKRRRRWSFTALMKRIKPKLIISRSRFNNSSSTRSIRTVFSTSPTGDVLDERQQQDILHQLRTMDERSTRGRGRGGLIASSSSGGSSSSGLRLRGGHHHQQRQRHRSNSFHRSSTTTTATTDEEAATRVAALDHIWVFRRLEEQDRFDDMPAVWTTFDYANQMTLMNEQDSDKGIEIFDSHVRQGQLPVLVIPRRQRGYFPLDMTGDAIVTLEIACLPNTKDVQFVLRQYSPP